MGKEHLDPKILGPGYWHRLHVSAYEANSPEKTVGFIRELKSTLSIFPCNTCRQHALGYLSEHPPENDINIHDERGRMIGMFRWMWMFHNWVNSRLQKPLLGWETAISLYNDGECSECGSPRSDPEESNGGESNGGESNQPYVMTGRYSPKPLSHYSSMTPYSV